MLANIRFTFLTLVAVTMALAKPNTAKKEVRMSDKEAAQFQQTLAGYKKALVDFDLVKLDGLCTGETRDMVLSAKTADSETKAFLKSQFQEMGRTMVAAKFDSPTLSGDSALVQGKNNGTKITVDLLRVNGTWKITGAMIDDSEAKAEELSK